MRQRFGAWLGDVRIHDPLARQQALLLQWLLLGMLAIIGLLTGLGPLVGPLALTTPEVGTNLALLVAALAALVLLRRGQFTLSAALVTGVILIGQTFHLVMGGFLGHEGTLIILVIPITLAGLVLGRRALWTVAALSVAIVAAAAALDPRTATAEARSLATTVGLFVATVAVFGLVLDRFSGMVRAALAAAMQRQHDLEAARNEVARANAELRHEVAEHARSEATVRFLADAGQQLATSLDVETTLATVARLAVPALADWCIIYLGTADTPRRLAVAHRDEAAAGWVRAVPPTLAHPLTPDDPVAVTLRHGRAVLLPALTPETLHASARDEAHRALLLGLGLRSQMVVPLEAHGRLLGAISLLTAESGRHYGADDLAVAEELARRVALALDHARLYQQTQAAEARYRGLFEGIDDAMVVADASGRFIEANPAAAELLGYSREELLQLRVGDLGDGEHEANLARFEHLRREGRWRGEVDLRRKDGTLVPTESWQRAVTLPDQRVYVAVWRDITERRAHERLQQEFLAMVTHDLKNPLTSIKAMAQLLQRRGTYREQTVEAIVIQANRLQRLVNDLLDVSRLETGMLALQRRAVDLGPLVRQAVEGARALTEAHQISLETPDHPVIVGADHDRVVQVLENLLTNAIKYAPEGGPIAVRLTACAEEVEIAVSDRGLGIPAEAVPFLFDRFHRTREAVASGIPGLGLGLYIVKGLVEAHGGRVRVDSVVGQGSTFTVTFPVALDGLDDATADAGDDGAVPD